MQFLELCTDKELDVRRYALESIGSVAFSKSSLLKPHMQMVIDIIQSESKFKPEYLIEIDLGPFKHKTDEGRALRVAAYTLLHICLEKLAEKVPSAAAIEVVLDALRDPDPDCQALGLQILMRVMQITPGIVLGQLHNIIDGASKIVEAEKKKSKTMVTNLLRIVVKAIL